MDQEDIVFCERLKELRIKHELSLDELSQAFSIKFPNSNLGKSQISRFENKLQVPKTVMLRAELSELFNVSIKYMHGKEEEASIVKVPVFEKIVSDIPLLLQQIEQHISDFRFILRSEGVRFCYKIKGDSMVHANIYDNYILYVKNIIPTNNDIVLVHIDGGAAEVRRICYDENSITLRAENPTYKEVFMKLSEQDRIKILGKVVKVEGNIV